MVSTCGNDADRMVTYDHLAAGWTNPMCRACAHEAFERGGSGEFAFGDLPPDPTPVTVEQPGQDAPIQPVNG